MAQDEVAVVYRAIPEGFDKVNASVNSVTAETKELQTQIKATFADKSIEAATKKLYEQGDVMGALINKYGSATTALKAMEKELATMAALGQRGTAQFKELANATAQLKDTVGDTRGEIKKMASDTKVFDTMVQGARGIAAAFSVATGLAASFGSENKDLQKTLLKVQGAMAALQGVQELANIATEKGGIATKAYGVALTVVDKISKVTGLSMAASWALATAGISVLITGVVALIYWLNKANDSSEELAEQEEDRAKRAKEYAEKSQQASYKRMLDNDKEFDRQQDIRRKQAILRNENADAIELGLLIEKQRRISEITRDFNLNAVFLSEEAKAERKKGLEDMALDVEVALKKIREKIAKGIKPATPGITAFKPEGFTDIEPFITETIVEENRTNAEQMAKDIRDSIEKTKKDEADALKVRQRLQENYWSTLQAGMQALSTITSNIFAQQSASIDEQRERDIARAGDDAKKKEKIEKDYAIKKAKVVREQAILEKSLAVFQIGIDTAKSIMAISADSTIPLPAKPAFYALAAATAALQLGAVMSKPLPQIPKFEKGGAVALAGGRIDNGYLIGRSHREGGILIEAQGKEYIWDEQTTAKHGDIIQAAHENRIEDLVMHKYVVPMIKNKLQTESNLYDDWLLRATIKNGQRADKKNAEYIADKVSQSVNSAIYNQNRYR